MYLQTHKCLMKSLKKYFYNSSNLVGMTAKIYFSVQKLYKST